MYDIIWNSIIPWNTLCRLMLVLSYWTLCLATGLFTNIQNMLELARCVKLHWSKRGVERNVSTSDSCQLEACGGARTHGWPWIPGKTWEEQNQLSLEMTCTFLMMCFQNLPLVFKQSVCECVCVWGVQVCSKKNCWFENSFLAVMTLNTFQVFRSAILDGMRAVRTHAQETWQPKPKQRLHHLLGRWPPMARSF